MKRLFLIILMLLVCLASISQASLTDDQIRELNEATPGTSKVALGTLFDTAQDDILVNSANISIIKGFTSDINQVEFLTTGDSSLSLSNVAYVRKWVGANDEALTPGSGTNQQEITFALVNTQGGSLFITPDTSSGFLDIELTANGESATMKFISSTLGWLLTGTVTIDASGGVTAKPAPYNN